MALNGSTGLVLLQPMLGQKGEMFSLAGPRPRSVKGRSDATEDAQTASRISQGLPALLRAAIVYLNNHGVHQQGVTNENR